MKIRNKLSMVIAGAIFIVLGTVGTTKAETIILESGSFIPSQVDPNAGYAIVGTQTVDQFLGWRFQLNNTLQVTDVGGYLSSYGNIFAAIVSLSSPTALPQGNPFLPGEILASTTFDAGFQRQNVITPLSIKLNPGNYGLIFGSGLFSASGEGSMLFNFGDFPEASYFVWGRAPLGASIRTGWYNGASDVRFVVMGQSVTTTSIPETTPTLVLLATGAFGAASMLKRQMKKRSLTT
jgi:hypothetical protein